MYRGQRVARRGGRYFWPGCLTLALSFVLFYVAAFTAPSNHDVLSAGGRSVGYQAAYSTLVHIVPTTSLEEARCQGWMQTRGGTCPSDGSLDRLFWPALKDDARTLYVGSNCGAGPFLNVEYAVGSVILHCHSAASWIHFEPRTLGTNAQPISVLVALPTGQMQPGPMTVYEEVRVERWLNDQVTTTRLGTLTLA